MDVSFYLSYLVVGVAGFTTGALTQLGYLKAKGRKVIIPFIEHSSRNFTVLAIALAFMSLFTIASVESASREYRDCQAQFQEALKYNTDLSQEQRALAIQQDSIEKSTRAAVVNFVVTVGSSDDAEERRQAFEDFVDTSTRLNDQLDRVESEVAKLETNRAPYPEPNCGLDQ
jgi:hypothetical protein